MIIFKFYDLQNYISDIYSRLVDDMHGVINTLVTTQESEVTVDLEEKEFFRFIYEAEHFNDLKSAERFHLQVIYNTCILMKSYFNNNILSNMCRE